MKKCMVVTFLVIFYCVVPITVVCDTRFLSEDHYRDRVDLYINVIQVIHANKLTAYLHNRINCADKALRGDVFVKQVEQIALANQEVFLPSGNNSIEFFFPRMVKENFDYYLRQGAGRRINFNKVEKENLHIEASKEFAEQILKFFREIKAKL